MSKLRIAAIKAELFGLGVRRTTINLQLVGIKDKNKEADLRLRLAEIEAEDKNLREEWLLLEPPVSIEGGGAPSH